MKKHRIKRGTVLMIIGAMMILGALSLALYNHIHEQAVGEESGRILSQLEELIVVTEKKDQETLENGEVINLEDELGSGENVDNIPVEPGETAISTKKESSGGDEVVIPEETTKHDPNNMAYKKIENHYYIGILDLPSVGVTLPVQWGWSDELMDISPCRYNGNTEENNLIILAHNYATHFGCLFNLNEGDKVTFADINGNLFRYRVKYIESFHRSEIQHIYEGEWDLTLFTCVPNTYNRLAVRCELIEE